MKNFFEFIHENYIKIILIYFIIEIILFVVCRQFISKSKEIESLKTELNSVKFEYEYIIYCTQDSLMQ